jgi:hypothetical protein
LVVFVDRQTSRGENAAVIVTAGLRTIFIDRTLAIGKHRALASIAVAHQNMSSREARSWE